MHLPLYDPNTNKVFWDEVLKIPEFKALENIPQNSLWHKEKNAFEHVYNVTQAMLDYIQNDSSKWIVDHDYRTVLVYAALLHDIGKPLTTKLGKDGLYHCPNHAIEGIPIAKKILDADISKFSILLKRSILSLVRYHMQPLYILDAPNPAQFLLKLVNNLNYIDFESLLLLKECDCKGAIIEVPYDYEKILTSIRKLFYEYCSYPEKTLVTIKKTEDSRTSKYSKSHHPNDINVGYEKVGHLFKPITIGFRTILNMQFSTSPVTKIIDKNHFETRNSVYEIQESKQ